MTGHVKMLTRLRTFTQAGKDKAGADIDDTEIRQALYALQWDTSGLQTELLDLLNESRPIHMEQDRGFSLHSMRLV